MFFCNSRRRGQRGGLKITRLTGRTKIVAAEGIPRQDHGRVGLTGQPASAIPSSRCREVVFVPYGDIAALAAAVDSNTAAVFLEPIMGRAGWWSRRRGLAAARDVTLGHGALLVLDEVQTGMGRTGAFYAHQRDGVVPDVVTLAKGWAEACRSARAWPSARQPT